MRNLGAYIDSGMSYTDRVTRLTRTCFFTFVSSGLSVGRSLWIRRTPGFEHWSWRDWITVTDSSVGHQSVSSTRCLASCGLQLVWFCCFLAPAVLKTRFVPCCTGWMFLASSESYFQAVHARSSVSSWDGSVLPRPLLHTRSALSLDAHISVRPPRACCLCPDRRRRQLNLGLSPSPPLLHRTVSRSIFVIPGSALWFLDVDSRLICSILLDIYPLSCPSHRTAISALYLFVNC